MLGINHINEYWWLLELSYTQPILPTTITFKKQTSNFTFINICIKTKKAKLPSLLTYLWSTSIQDENLQQNLITPQSLCK